ncbi:hypothetical protein ACLOJK_032083 [Asimina triloba]
MRAYPESLDDSPSPLRRPFRLSRVVLSPSSEPLDLQHSSSSHNSNARPSSPIYPSQSESFMDGNIAAAETIISKWDPDSSSYARVTSLFYESR